MQLCLFYTLIFLVKISRCAGCIIPCNGVTAKPLRRTASSEQTTIKRAVTSSSRSRVISRVNKQQSNRHQSDAPWRVRNFSIAAVAAFRSAGQQLRLDELGAVAIQWVSEWARIAHQLTRVPSKGRISMTNEGADGWIMRHLLPRRAGARATPKLNLF